MSLLRVDHVWVLLPQKGLIFEQEHDGFGAARSFITRIVASAALHNDHPDRRHPPSERPRRRPRHPGDHARKAADAHQFDEHPLVDTHQRLLRPCAEREPKRRPNDRVPKAPIPGHATPTGHGT